MHAALKSEDAKKEARIAELQSLYASEQKGREENARTDMKRALPLD